MKAYIKRQKQRVSPETVRKRKAFEKKRMIAVGKRVRELRAEAGLTRFDVAERTGISYNVISELENGRHDCKESTLKWLLKVMGWSLSKKEGE